MWLPISSRLERFPEQAASRKGFALIGLGLWVAGFIVGGYLREPPLPLVFFVLGALFCSPAYLLGQLGYARMERVFGWLG
jgi:hypothetical protein